MKRRDGATTIWFSNLLTEGFSYQKENEEIMVNLLSDTTLRIMAALMSFFAVSSVISHSFIFIILFANSTEEPLGLIPYSIMGQGLWCGGTSIITCAVLFTYVQSRQKERIIYVV